MDYWLKQSNKECEVLINENKRQNEELKRMGETSNRIAEELKSSLEVRGKLNSNMWGLLLSCVLRYLEKIRSLYSSDESEETLKIMKGRIDTLRDGMKCAEEYIKELENQIEEMVNWLLTTVRIMCGTLQKTCISPWDNGHPISHTPLHHRFPPYNQMTPPSPISPLIHAFRPNPNPFPSPINYQSTFNHQPFNMPYNRQFGPGHPNHFNFRM